MKGVVTMKAYDDVLKAMLADDTKSKRVKKVLLAYDLGYEEYTEEVDAILEKVYEFYMDNDDITFFENTDIIEYHQELTDKDL